MRQANAKIEDLQDSDVRSSLKTVAAVLDYPKGRGIPINRIDTHSLRIGGANALSLAGCSKQQIQKMGRVVWRDLFGIHQGKLVRFFGRHVQNDV
jgi:hypothetical protein